MTWIPGIYDISKDKLNESSNITQFFIFNAEIFEYQACWIYH